MARFNSEAIDRLFESILKLETLEECYDFFEDVCTIKEVQDMAQRLEAAFLLYEGLNYQEISKRTGISTATISRVNRCLNYGSGGYKRVIQKAKEQDGSCDK